MKDLLISAGLVMFGLVAIYMIQMTPIAGKSMTDALKFSTLPTIYATCLVLLSLILGGSSIKKILKERGKKDADISAWGKMEFIRLLATLVLILIYVVILQQFNFAIATFCFLFLLLLLYGRKPIWKVALTSLIGAVVFYGLFIEFLQLPIR